MERQTLYVPNVHCPTCVEAITSLLSSPPLNCTDVSVSILTRTVTYAKSASGSTTYAQADRDILKALATAGFPPKRSDQDVESGSSPDDLTEAPTRKPWFETKKSRKRREAREAQVRWEAHLAACKACQRAERERVFASDKSSLGSVITEKEPQLSKSGIFKTVIELDGLTCTACVSAVEGLLKPGKHGIVDRFVTLFPQRVEILHDATTTAEDLANLIDDGGYGAVVQSTDRKDALLDGTGWTESKFEVGGMTCACVAISADNLTMSDVTRCSGHAYQRSAICSSKNSLVCALSISRCSLRWQLQFTTPPF